MKKYRVLASLKYGKVYPRIIRIFALVGFIAGMIALPGIIVIFIQERDPAFLFLILFVALAISSFIYAYIKLIEVSKNVLLALKDGVELQGGTTRTDSKGKSAYGYILDERLTVKFFYEGKKYIKVSEKPNAKRPFLGYKIFQRYVGKSIPILYSKTQDDVLIIK